MTTVLLLYYALLVLWLPLLWPACRTSGGKRVWLLLVAAAGLLATLHEIRMVFWTTAAIRLDIFLITPALGGLYVSAAVILLRAARRRAAGALALVLALIGAGMGYEWVAVGKQSALVMANFHTRNALLFEAKFRSRETYEAVFGPFTGVGADTFPVGHWQAEDASPYRRLIVNAHGRIRLFYPCGATECDFGSRGSALRGTGDGAANHWRATLRPHVSAPLELSLSRAPSGGLSLTIRGVMVKFSKAPPPIAARPARRTLTYLGRFARLQCRGNHAKIDQLWLWRAHGELFAIGIFSVLPTGQHAKFVSPEVMGPGIKDGEGWKFQWRHNGKSWNASVAIEGSRVILTRMRSGRAPERTVLEAKAIFTDEAIGLAPLTTKEDWVRWFAVVFTGHFTSGDVPAC
ncbi:MAG: hypothetical protein O7F75_01010 [Alphaproteobacteria bacterium]|nr:hypothetical protein [Alphaproteobacteria bacterium]